MKYSLTHNLHKQHSLVLSSRVGDRDIIFALILPLCPLYDEAAHVFLCFHPHTPFTLCDLLIDRKLQHQSIIESHFVPVIQMAEAIANNKKV